MRRLSVLSRFSVFSLLLATSLHAQIILHHQVIRPSVPTPPPSTFAIKLWNVTAQVKDQAAKVQISQGILNTSSQQAEAQLLFPLPADAAVSGLTLLIDGKEVPGKLYKKEEARKIYEEIVRRDRDPALLEYVGRELFQTSVFPLPPQGERKVELRYQQFLKQDQGMTSLLLPIGASRSGSTPIQHFTLDVTLETTQPLKSIYSSTHQPVVERQGDKAATCKLELKDVASTSDFRLFFNSTTDPVGLSLLGYKPVANEDGYFLLLANPELKPTDAKPLDKTVLCIVDRSGSMSGEKIVQAREALKFVLQRLHPGDLFNIIDYSDDVASFRPELLRAEPQNIAEAVAYSDRLRAGGSTNIDGALQTGLKMLSQASQPQYVLFFTDGLPTAGEQNDLKISENVRLANAKQARLFNFGVGYDVNSRLLDRLSRDNRGLSVYVRPNENLETVVSSFYNRIGEPQLTDLQISLTPSGSSESLSLLSYPRILPDLFAGEQFVWVGRYSKGGDIQVVLRGKAGPDERTYTLQAKLPTVSADSSASFVEKLWANRRIGEIIDQLDLNGKNQELIDELVQLSMKHGIMTPYTSFLAQEDVSLADRFSNRERASRESEQLSIQGGRAGFAQRAYKSRLQQSINAPAAADANLGGSLPGLGEEKDESSADKRSTLRQIQSKTFFLKQNRWYDSNLKEGDEKSARQIRQYSDEWFALASEKSGEYAPLLAQSGELVLQLGNTTYHVLPAE